MFKRNLVFLLFVVLAMSACVEVQNQYSVIPPGIWRATLNIGGEGADQFLNTENETDRVFTELTDGELPFNFEVVYNTPEDVDIILLNADERILVEDVKFGRDPSTLEDSVRIEFPVFDSYIIGRYEENRIQGYFVVNYRENYKIPFSAEFGRAHRFTNLKKEPKSDLSGKWEATFELESDGEYKGIGEFVQDGNKLTGTFRTETGDYRYLEGTVQENKAYLSAFDGAHAFLLQAKILEDGSLIGSFRSGTHYLTNWKAVRNENFELSDPNQMTMLKEQENFFFEFTDTDGQQVSIEDKRFDNKPMLVSLFGTWCTNSKDEMDFLKDYFDKNPDLDINMVGIAFGKYRDDEKSMDALKTYKEEMGIEFDLLYGGFSKKDEAGKQLPMLNRIISYPTLVFLDKDKNVRQIHTGFSGPATSKYDVFTEDFDNLVKTLVKE